MRRVGSYEPADQVLGSVGTVEDDGMVDENSIPYYGAQTGPSFEQAATASFLPSDPPTVRSGDVALLQSLKSPFPHSRERYQLGPLKGLPERCSDKSYTDLEEACLIRHFTENLAPWVRVRRLIFSCWILLNRVISLTPAIETDISSYMSLNERSSALSYDTPFSQPRRVI